MKTSVFLFFTALVIYIPGIISGATYYYTVDRGIENNFDMQAAGGKVILSGPGNDVYSGVQDLPFDWNFFGETVRRYKISDNGFITFDTEDSLNTGSNSEIPSPDGPNKAIYAFWDNLELSNNPNFITNDVKTYTIGQAPQRIHVIQWHATPRGKMANSNYIFFAIRIYEGGDFDIILQQIRLDQGNRVTATVGCENSDGTDGTMIEGSPNFTFTGGQYLPENVPVYRFIRGIQPKTDILLHSLELPRLVESNNIYQFTGELFNHGSDTITSFSISYAVDNGKVITDNILDLKIVPNDYYTYHLWTEWQPDNPGTFQDVKLWISSVNGREDQNHSNDTLSRRVFVAIGIYADKKVLIEEFSTAPCGYCPDGHIILDDIINRYGNVIGVIHHSGYMSDSMTIPISAELADLFAQGAPSACIDRIHWPGNIRLATARTGWQAHTLESFMRPSPLDIILHPGWDYPARRIDIIAEFNFIDYAYPGDLRVNLFVVEDSVVGVGDGYDQSNYFNDTPGHPLFGKGDPIKGYVHNHVMRHSLTSTLGDEGIIPNNPAPGTKITKNYSWTVPDYIKPDNISIVAFVSYFDGETYDILNAESLSGIASGVEDHQDIAGLNAYPNPASEYVEVRYTGNDTGINYFELYDIFGCIVRTMEITPGAEPGVCYGRIKIDDLLPGVYFIRANNGGKVYTHKITIAR